ncbi:MAG: NAD(P)-dependent glycerol-3-phosphate dehydrogenase [Betaproteobacteria bacterium]|nr:NAD(P)-dependent glycerol-3-phosphate dehydrogenase [Betaproteobacteria bacterium]
MNIAVLGAGAWGTAMAVHLAARHSVALWARDAAQAAAMQSARVNQRYLRGVTLPPQLKISADFNTAHAGATLILAGVTTAGLRDVLNKLKAAGSSVPVVWLCKGFEREHALLPHQVCAEALPNVACGVLSGPSFADEVARGLPAALTLASTDAAFAANTARELHGGSLRVYSSTDVIGVEVAGAVKNVMAIASGICDGLKLGLNARAALMTRGLAEITRLGVALGGRAETFMGLAGVGDLILTCTGDLSRNRRVGLRLAEGQPLADILNELGHVAEGVYTAREVARLALQRGITMPITEAVCRVLDQPQSAARVARELLERDAKAESS